MKPSLDPQVRSLRSRLLQWVRRRRSGALAGWRRVVSGGAWAPTPRMELLGRLAGIMAHDLNNLLAVILSCCDPAERALAPGDPVLPCIVDIRHAAEQATALTRQILSFARGQAPQDRPFDPVALVRTSRAILGRLLGNAVTIRIDAPRAVRSVMGDPGRIEQVLLNLAVNARDAMPAGGVLTLEVRDVAEGDSILRRRAGVRPRPHVLLAITDTGTGIDPATRARMFEPLFTTKAPGRGTGLGLAIVQAIVTEAGGFIEVFTRPGTGTRFEIYLPAADPRVAGSTP